MPLRDYQRNAVDRAKENLAEHRSTLVVMPTGTGKTVVFANTIDEMTKTGGRAMILAHREELIRQAASKVQQVTGETPEIEMAGEHADLHFFRKAKVVVSSIQTLNAREGKRLAKFKPQDFELVVVDEAHHATANSYRKVFDHFLSGSRTKILGVTATPDRADEEALGQVFKSVAFVYEITDAINDGWLVPISQRFVQINSLDFSDLHSKFGDFNQEELARMMEYEQNMQGIVWATLQHAKWKHVLVFAASVAAAERMTEIFNRHKTGSARWLCGETPKDERRQILADYNERKFQFLVNVGVLTEGFDEPLIDMVVMARPTKSRSLYCQMIGRGTRPLPKIVDGISTADARRLAIAQSSKPEVEVLDFEGNSGRHKLVTTLDILGGKHTPRVMEIAAQKIKDSHNAMPVEQALREAEEEDHKEQEAEKERERVRRQSLKAKATYSSTTVDPFSVFDIAPPIKRGWDTAYPPSDKQRDFLERNGIAVPEGMTKTEAGALVTEVITRRNEGKCSYKQAKLLAKYGYSTDMSFADAKTTIDAIAANGWKRPVEAVAQETA